jgi:phosphoglucomutase
LFWRSFNDIRDFAGAPAGTGQRPADAPAPTHVGQLATKSKMALHPLAGKPAPPELLVNVARLVTAYFTGRPDPHRVEQQVVFGTSGHRGSSLENSFNEAHVLAITQAICEQRARAHVTGPLFVGIDPHALSEPALATVIEVLAGNGVETVLEAGRRYTPTPVISHAILTHNRKRDRGHADGIVITPSHNPPSDGGLKYNPPCGGPADAETTRGIAARANQLLSDIPTGVKRLPLGHALHAETTREQDLIGPYLRDLAHVVDLEAVSRAGLRLGVHPLGGASVGLWEPIADHYGLNLELVDGSVDPTFRMLTVDRDGKLRMDCSSPWAMAGLVALRDRFDLAFGADGDADRFGIVTRSGGLLAPNHFLSVAVRYLFESRTRWPARAAVGKTLVSSSMLDRIARQMGRSLVEVPVGFKWFVEGLLGGSLGFGGEESAGASCLRHDGTVWTTDKDGVLMDLLAAEITAKTGRDPAEQYRLLEEQFGSPVYERKDVVATAAQKAVLGRLSAEQVQTTELAGERILAKLTRAPGNDAPIGGLKVVTDNGWFAARPSGTEEVYKIYAESFLGPDHLRRIQDEAETIVARALQAEC